MFLFLMISINKMNIYSLLKVNKFMSSPLRETAMIINIQNNLAPAFFPNYLLALHCPHDLNIIHNTSNTSYNNLLLIKLLHSNKHYEDLMHLTNYIFEMNSIKYL